MASRSDTVGYFPSITHAGLIEGAQPLASFARLPVQPFRARDFFDRPKFEVLRMI
jgi:hypothetical protein